VAPDREFTTVVEREGYRLEEAHEGAALWMRVTVPERVRVHLTVDTFGARTVSVVSLVPEPEKPKRRPRRRR